MAPALTAGRAMGMLDDDVAAMMADTALTVPVVYGARTTRGYKDKGSRIVTDADGNQFQVVGEWLHFNTDDTVLGSIEQDEALTVDGVAYLSGQSDYEGDGKVRVLHLRRA